MLLLNLAQVTMSRPEPLLTRLARVAGEAAPTARVRVSSRERMPAAPRPVGERSAPQATLSNVSRSNNNRETPSRHFAPCRPWVQGSPLPPAAQA